MAIPVKLRRVMTPDAQETFIATRGMENCIVLYPLDVWEVKEAKLHALNQYEDDETRHFLRALTMWAEDISLDSQGRVLLPSGLRDFAGISDTAIVIGALDHVEVWEPDELDAYFAEQPNSYKDAAQQVMGGRS